MPDLQNRDRYEREITAAILGVFDQYSVRITNGERFAPGRLRNDLRASLRAVVPAPFMASAERLAEQFEIEADWQLAAKEWAADYLILLTDDIADVSLDLWRDGRSRGLSRADLAGRIFGRQRAENIGITETTRSSSRGEFEVRNQLRRRFDITIVAVWRTEISGVCPVCRAFRGLTEAAWGSQFPNGPPAHPRCRCWLEWIRSRGY